MLTQISLKLSSLSSHKTGSASSRLDWFTSASLCSVDLSLGLSLRLVGSASRVLFNPTREGRGSTHLFLSLSPSLPLFIKGQKRSPASHPAHFPSCFMRQIGHKLLPKPIWGKHAPVNHSGPPLELGWGQFSTGTCLQGGEEGTWTKSGIC